MEIIDNISKPLKDDLKNSVAPNAKVRMAACCFPIYVFEALRKREHSAHIDNLKGYSTFDWGVDCSLLVQKEDIDGKSVYFVDQNALAACFDTGITEDMVKKLVARKPLRVVFCDSGLSRDAVKINVEQIFKLLSPDTEVKAI